MFSFSRSQFMYTGIILTVVAFGLSGCAGSGVQHRAWLGGSLVQVKREANWIGTNAPSITYGGEVVGMPDNLAQAGCLLLVEVPESSPLAEAGLRQGDLLLSIDDTPLVDTSELYDVVETLNPGQNIDVEFWRDGQTQHAHGVVGVETYQERGRISIFLGFSPSVDIWPFDGDFDILGLVGFSSASARRDLDTPQHRYLHSQFPDAKVDEVPQEDTCVYVIPLGIGKSVEVLGQECWRERDISPQDPHK